MEIKRIRRIIHRTDGFSSYEDFSMPVAGRSKVRVGLDLGSDSTDQHLPYQIESTYFSVYFLLKDLRWNLIWTVLPFNIKVPCNLWLTHVLVNSVRWESVSTVLLLSQNTIFRFPQQLRCLDTTSVVLSEYAERRIFRSVWNFKWGIWNKLITAWFSSSNDLTNQIYPQAL